MTLEKYRNAGLEFNSGHGAMEFGGGGGYIERVDNTGFEAPARESKTKLLAGGTYKALSGPRFLQGAPIIYKTLHAFKSSEASWDVMMPGCIARTLAGNQAIRCQLDHKNGSDYLLGTTNDRLILHDTEDALFFRLELDDTEAAHEAKTGVEDGSRTGMSPSYVPKAWYTENVEGVGAVRFLTDIDLYEVSLVSNGAMIDAFCNLVDVPTNTLAAECKSLLATKRKAYVSPLDQYRAAMAALGVSVYGIPRHLQ